MLETKLKSLKAIEQIASKSKKRGKKIVFTNGCFDLLHYGHVRYLEDAKNYGDLLIVALNSDASVRKIKGKYRPVVSERYRAGVIAGLESVDYVILFNERTPENIIKRIKPDVLVKGADWKKSGIIGADFVLKNGGCVKTVKLVKSQSTTNLIKKIARSFQS